MSFGQVSGPPAAAKQVEYLASLLEERDYGTFREARHRLGLTQRQANGKFTAGEAADLIELLLAESPDDEPADAPVAGATSTAAPAVAAAPPADRAAARLQRQHEEVVAAVSDVLLAEELERRGWCCIAPTP
jgi:hypothetical protein